MGKTRMKMEIGIITVFNSENCGSVLQAYALREALKTLGYESLFVNVSNPLCSHMPMRCFLRTTNRILHGSIRGALDEVQKYLYFDRVIKQLLPSAEPEDLDKRGVDTFILGSDTVWDVERKRFLLSAEYFWPQWPGKNVIVYGASAANSTADMLRKLAYPEAALKQFWSISVRDTHTQNAVMELTDRKIETVCDPTMLLDASAYNRFQIPVIGDDLIAVYLSESLNEKEIQQISKFAEKNKLRMVAIGKKIPWCDTYVPCRVENFISYLHAAKYVVTNTFHGTVFSILFQKQFLSFGRSKKKVMNLLEQLGLQKRMYTETSPVETTLRQPVDYGNADRLLGVLRRDSMAYLNRQIRSVELKKRVDNQNEKDS